MSIKILTIGFITCFFTFMHVDVKQKDVFETLSAHFKNANSKEIAGYFASVIELNVLSEEGEYSKAQAELILRDFFSKHPVTNTRVVHRLSSNPNFLFGVLSVQSHEDNFRISISMADSGNKYLIKSIRIENDKE